jgi:PRTRC genetic system protein E
MPLLKQRAVMITISDLGEGLLRVNIIPRRIEGSSEDNAALTTPLSITGRAEELDRELPGQLTSFTESIAKTGSNLEELRTQHSAAVKAMEAENKKKLDDKKKANGSKTVSTPPKPTPPAEFKEGKPVFGSRTSPSGESRSLFDTATDQADADVVEQPAEDEATAPPPQHPSASANSYPD